MRTIEIKVPCEIHGLEIYHSEVERIEKQIEGYPAKTIARWIHKNSNLDTDWWTIFRYAQSYHIEEVDGVILNPEFYSNLEEKKERFFRINRGDYLKEDINKEEY